jgi:monofunctional glycosyltransferase
MVSKAKKTVKNFFSKMLFLALWLVATFFVTSLYQVIYFKYFNPWMTYKMFTNKIDLLFSNEKDKTLYYKWVSMDEVSSFVPLAVIAAEDQKFPVHNGFDFDAIQKAMEYNQKSKKIRGGSTISQQVSKNIFLWHGRSYLRKGLEIYYTFLIETIWGKKRILEMYINIAEMGPNIYGVGAASKKYWNKDATKLTKYESGILAAVLPSPTKYSAQRPSGYVLKRRDWIVGQMNQLGGVKYLDKL